MVLIGRVTKDAVVSQLKDERKVVNFSLAINDYYKPKGSDKGVSQTTYYDCSYWVNPTIATRLTKGSLVELNGRISVDVYKAMDGEPRARLKCHVNNVTIHQSNKNTVSATSQPKAEPVDDLPF